MVLKQTGDKSLGRFYETFHGTDVSIQRPVSPEIAIFYITQDTQRHPLLPEIKSGGFRVTGRISTLCSLLDPISGELTVETSAVPISSIDIHLLRVESVLVGEKIIADGDVCRNLTLPIYVILPRLLTCPSVFAGPFSIEFKVSIVISFQSELSKLHKKSDPRTPRLWQWKLYRLNLFEQDKAICKDNIWRTVHRIWQWKLYRLNLFEQDEAICKDNIWRTVHRM
uniref:Uncharacterized protein n=1 Tax=Salix viminalis TaxID=40686 RepID=A0A6N2LVG5_SALVM